MQNEYALELRSEAVSEFASAYIWYEEQRDNLGDEFKIAIDKKLKLICKNPSHYKSAYKNYHEAVTDRFPFVIVYTINAPPKSNHSFCYFPHQQEAPEKIF